MLTHRVSWKRLWKACCRSRREDGEFEIGRIPNLKSEIRNFKLDKGLLLKSRFKKRRLSNLKFRISDLQCRIRVRLKGVDYQWGKDPP